MDRSRISAAAKAAGHELTYARSPEALVGMAGVDLAIVDLSKRGVAEVIADVVESGIRVIAFGSHVDTKLLNAATEAGANTLPRSKFFADIPAMLR